jgi:hypothetical protein
MTTEAETEAVLREAIAELAAIVADQEAQLEGLRAALSGVNAPVPELRDLRASPGSPPAVAQLLARFDALKAAKAGRLPRRPRIGRIRMGVTRRRRDA